MNKGGKIMKISKIVIWSIVTLILICIVVNLIIFSKYIPWGFNWNRTLIVVYDETIYETEDIENLNIDWRSGSVNVYKSDDDTIKIIQRAYRELDNDQKVKVSTNNSTLSIKEGKRHISIGIATFLSDHTELDLYLPEKEYKNVKIGLTSGDVEIEGLTSKTCNIKLTSRKSGYR